MVYRCRVCGYLFDEEKEGTSISQLKECPVCGQPAENFVPVEPDGNAREIPEDGADIGQVDGGTGHKRSPLENNYSKTETDMQDILRKK